MLFQGKTLRAQALSNGVVELIFDREDDVINKFDQATLQELRAAIAAIGADTSVKGLLVTSAKSVFIVGADIKEFGAMFRHTEPELVASLAGMNEVFTAFEDLELPSVVAVNGFALGGGAEFVLASALRVMSTTAQIGLPEVRLGLLPGWGGTVRLPRVAGVQVAIDWITSGQPRPAEAALAAGVVNAIAEPGTLRDTALDLLGRAIEGTLDWRVAQQRKRIPLPLSSTEIAQLCGAARAQVSRSAPRHQPAALAAVETMERSASLERAAALDAEGATFARLARTQAADALIQTFLNAQKLKKLCQQHAGNARPIRQGAVLGAGIMGGGIAYTSALRGIPVRLKDIAQSQLDLGMGEAGKRLGQQVKGGRMSQEQAGKVLGAITPQLDYAGFRTVDVVIEAVVEHLGIKCKVLAELEDMVREDTVIASNTSSLRIDDIAAPLKRPENFVGMHFFNPVPAMPLVEIIKGARTSEQAVSTAVGYAVAMGKTPIVVKDCPGFLVNRVLAAYMRGFLQLLADGADFEQCDQVLEAFGWPMGPAYLQDVIGIDTGIHASEIISAGYADRMPRLEHDALRLMASQQRYGQKNGIGFYRYELDPAGKPKRSAAEDTRTLLARIQPGGSRDFSEQEIVERCMLPLIIEAAHALEDGIVASPAELDQALLMGIGFPAYLGGALKYADWLGLAQACERAQAYAQLGKAYEPTARMQEMAAQGRKYYG